MVMTSLPLELIEKLPKTDLHCHLDGSLRLKTMLELAEQQGVKLPADTEEGLAKAGHFTLRAHEERLASEVVRDVA